MASKPPDEDPESKKTDPTLKPSEAAPTGSSKQPHESGETKSSDPALQPPPPKRIEGLPQPPPPAAKKTLKSAFKSVFRPAISGTQKRPGIPFAAPGGPSSQAAPDTSTHAEDLLTKAGLQNLPLTPIDGYRIFDPRENDIVSEALVSGTVTKMLYKAHSSPLKFKWLSDFVEENVNTELESIDPIRMALAINPITKKVDSVFTDTSVDDFIINSDELAGDSPVIGEGMQKLFDESTSVVLMMPFYRGTAPKVMLGRLDKFAEAGGRMLIITSQGYNLTSVDAIAAAAEKYKTQTGRHVIGLLMIKPPIEHYGYFHLKLVLATHASYPCVRFAVCTSNLSELGLGLRTLMPNKDGFVSKLKCSDDSLFVSSLLPLLLKNDRRILDKLDRWFQGAMQNNRIYVANHPKSIVLTNEAAARQSGQSLRMTTLTPETQRKLREYGVNTQAQFVYYLKRKKDPIVQQIVTSDANRVNDATQVTFAAVSKAVQGLIFVRSHNIFQKQIDRTTGGNFVFKSSPLRELDSWAFSVKHLQEKNEESEHFRAQNLQFYNDAYKEMFYACCGVLRNSRRRSPPASGTDIPKYLHHPSDLCNMKGHHLHLHDVAWPVSQNSTRRQNIAHYQRLRTAEQHDLVFWFLKERKCNEWTEKPMSVWASDIQAFISDKTDHPGHQYMKFALTSHATLFSRLKQTLPQIHGEIRHGYHKSGTWILPPSPSNHGPQGMFRLTYWPIPLSWMTPEDHERVKVDSTRGIPFGTLNVTVWTGEELDTEEKGEIQLISDDEDEGGGANNESDEGLFTDDE